MPPIWSEAEAAKFAATVTAQSLQQRFFLRQLCKMPPHGAIICNSNTPPKITFMTIPHPQEKRRRQRLGDSQTDQLESIPGI
jgi:hypothetical protein